MKWFYIRLALYWLLMYGIALYVWFKLPPAAIVMAVTATILGIVALVSELLINHNP